MSCHALNSEARREMVNNFCGVRSFNTIKIRKPLPTKKSSSLQI